jgi:hypothetical protein
VGAIGGEKAHLARGMMLTGEEVPPPPELDIDSGVLSWVN